MGRSFYVYMKKKIGDFFVKESTIDHKTVQQKPSYVTKGVFYMFSKKPFSTSD